MMISTRRQQTSFPSPNQQAEKDRFFSKTNIPLKANRRGLKKHLQVPMKVHSSGFGIPMNTE
jgi:hypothetical protein